MKYKLKDIGKITTGKTPSKSIKNAFGGNMNFLTPTDFNGKRYSDSTVRSLSDNGVEAVSNYVVKYPSISVTCIGSDMGKTILNRTNIVSNQQINSISEIIDDINPKYLYYLLTAKRKYLHFLGSGQGSTMPILNKRDFGNIEFFFPEKEQQDSIVKILDVLDKKIELNKAINDNLDALLTNIFKKYMINDDFEKSNLTQIANYKNGLAMQKYRPNSNEESLPVLKIKELNQGNTDDSSDRCSANLDNSVIVNTGDIIFSWSGTLLVKNWTGDKVGLNQHLFKVTSNKYPAWFIYEWTKYHLLRFQAIAAGKATTMGHIKRSDLKSSPVYIPSQLFLEKMDSQLAPIYSQRLNLIKENQQLSKLKQTLLNKYF
ncbi:restriction endonuclease subunit S [Limosilactobacillus reuteri subsp. suis]|uniref:restriction endonuclease subunit S n=1 Tax=Limosilactobacillus reuteri TaxID=1598 RepID=UPI003993B48D